MLHSSKLGISFNTWRLHFIWWGAVLLLIGLVLYWLFCPRSVKRGASAEDYVSVQYPLPDDHRLNLVLKARVRAFMEAHPGEAPNEILIAALTRNVLNRAANVQLHEQNRADLLRFEWEQDNLSTPPLRRITTVMMIAGATLFLIPSVEVSLRVLMNLIGTV